MNPLFDMFGQKNQNGMFPFNMMQSFNQFRQAFRGDAEQQVRDLLSSGQMSQEQFNQLSSMAQTFQQFIK